MASIATGIANALLLQRLKWPVPMVRWRAAREIRDLLETGATHDRIVSELLDFLERCATESEVCSVLNLVFLTSIEARPARDEIVTRIKCPSILADFLLEKTFGLGMGLGGWGLGHSGEVPEEFEPSEYFIEHKTAHVPPIFYNELCSLERVTGLPFVRQWAWEWQNLRERLGTGFTSYPHYFDEHDEANAGVVGQYHQRQSEVFRSAHIRTITLAVTTWAMPVVKAYDYLLDHIPAIGGVFDLNPGQRPEGLLDLPTKCPREDSDLRIILSEWVAENRATDNPCVSIVSPFPRDLARHGEVYVGAYFVSKDFEMGESHGLYEPIDPVVVKDTLAIDGVVQDTVAEQMKHDGKAGWFVPVCSSFFPIPYGFWNSDYFALGFPVVAPYCLPVHSAIRGGESLELVAEGEVVARTRIWNDVWMPTYPRGGNTRCGIAAELKRCWFDELPNRAPMGSKLAWFIRTRIWKRPTKYGEYAMEERRVLLLDEAI